jgi:hypothetical protein
MVILATLIQTVFHPGFCFPRLSSAYVVPQVASPPPMHEKDLTETSGQMTPPNEVADTAEHTQVKNDA